MSIPHPADRALPPELKTLCDRLAPPDDAEDAHPLVTVLGRNPAGERLGVLWWPTPDATATLPIVAGCGPRLRWWAASASCALHRWFAEEDAAGRWRSEDAEDAGRVGYAPQAVHAAGLARYLALARLDPWDAAVARALAHVTRGDPLAARVAGDRDAARDPSWAAALRTRWAVAVRLGDVEVAREAATAMMGLPLWTFEQDWVEVARWSGWREPIDASPYRRLAEDRTRPPADRAAWWLDLAAAENRFAPNLRARLAALYAEAGLQAFASFVGRAVTSPDGDLRAAELRASDAP